MIKFNIGKLKIKMPNRVSEISLSTGLGIMNLIEDHEPTIKDKISVISLLSGTDPLIISLIYDEDIEVLWNKIEFVSKYSFQLRLLTTFSLKGTIYGLKNLEDLTVKEFAEIEYYLNEGNSIYDYMAEIISILYRPVISKTRSPFSILFNIISRIRYKIIVPLYFSSYEIEPLKDNHIKNATLFNRYCDFGFGYGVMDQLFKYKEQLQKEYKILFYNEEQKEEEEKLTKSEIEFGDIWGMYYLVVENSQNIFEREAWWNKPLKEFYKFLAYQKQKAIYSKHGR